MRSQSEFTSFHQVQDRISLNYKVVELSVSRPPEGATLRSIILLDEVNVNRCDPTSEYNKTHYSKLQDGAGAPRRAY